LKTNSFIALFLRYEIAILVLFYFHVCFSQVSFAQVPHDQLKALSDEKTQIGSASCQKDLSLLPAVDLKSLSREEKIAFLRAKEDETKKVALELHQLLTEELARKLFEKEQQIGLAPTEPISTMLTVEEIVRRLVIISASKE
jgi:hypothetical protein